MTSYRWRWDIGRIRQTAVADNVVDLMVRKIERLPAATIELLTTASCIGNSFKLSLLALVHDASSDEVLADLSPAVAEGFVIPAADFIKFSHDRIQEAVYSLISDDDRTRIHYRIGTLLLANTPEAEFDEKLFMIVDQLNAGSAIIVNQEEKYRLAELNLRAGKKAISSIAYEMAARYFKSGMENLSIAHWESDYQVIFDLHYERAACEYLINNYAAAENIFKELGMSKINNKDLVKLYFLKIELFAITHRFREAVEIGVNLLKQCKIYVPMKPSYLRLVAQYYWTLFSVRRNIKTNLPRSDNPESVEKWNIFNHFMMYCYYYDNKLTVLLLLKYIPLASKTGISPHTVYSITGIPIAFRINNHYLKFKSLFKECFACANATDNKVLRTKILFNYCTFVNHWISNLSQSKNILRQCFHHSLESGDFSLANASAFCLLSTEIICGDNLAEIYESYITRYESFIKNISNPSYQMSFSVSIQFVKNLMGRTKSIGSFSDGDYDEYINYSQMRSFKNQMVTCWYLTYKLMTYAIFDDCDLETNTLHDIIILLEKYSFLFFAQPMYCEYVFHHSLVMLKKYQRLNIKRVYRLYKNRKNLLCWLENCPENFLHKYLLVQAELARVTGKKQKDETGKRCEPEELYDRAIASAHENEYQQNEAIANELAAKYYLSKGRTKVAALYMKEARDGFARWGATAKVRQLEGKYSELLSRDRREETGSGVSEISAFTTVELQSKALDHMSAVKASQAIAGEIVLPNLLEKLMKIAMENAGATGGCILMEQNDALDVEVSGDPEGIFVNAYARYDRPGETPSPTPEGQGGYPQQIVNLAWRTNEPVVIADVHRESRFAADPYIQSRKPKSILCMTLSNHRKVIGVIYLENAVSAGAFTPARIETLRMILSQGAVSIENARLYAEMEGRVRERTHALEAANDQLKSLDRAKTEFFANVSHELRTPLTLMLSPISSVLQGAYPGTVDETFFRKLYSNGARLLGLINNLLDFSKIEAGRMTVKAERVDVSRELELCAANFHSAAQAKGLTLSCEDHAGGVEAHVDRDLFRKAVYNLLGNAIKFTSGGGKISVVLYVSEGSFTVSVADTGIGIPADKHGIIFERFAQADASSTRKYEGTGIGLSLTREIARLHGGDVTFRSVEGEGSTFYLTMPLHMEALEGSEPQIKGSEPRAEGFIGESEPRVDRKSPAEGSDPPICECSDPDAPRVLIVEDNPDMLSFLSEIVGSRYRVIRARNGKEALAAIGEAAEPFDLILSDVMMPEMDGLELLAAVRADAAYEGVPVLLLTAKADDAMKLEGFGKGATDYIVKPFNALELLARIASQLELKEVRDRLARANAVLYRRLSERGASSATVGASAEEKVARVVEFIAENFTADISREGLAAAVDLSPDHLSRAFNKVTGRRIDEHINELRIEEAKRRLRETDETVISIAMGVGFESVRTFNKVFAKIAGMPPTRWREGKLT
mgnify:CR=1 FL=1